MFITSMSTEIGTPQCLPHLKIQAIWSVRYLLIFIEFRFGLHIIYRHPFINGDTADRAPLTFYAASTAYNVMPARKQDHINLFFKAHPT